MNKAKIDPSTETQSEFSQLVNQLTHSAQEGLKKEIALHKANGRPIFYSHEGIPIKELPNGDRFEYKLDENGIEVIIRKLPQ
jgi:hypothetical protein